MYESKGQALASRRRFGKRLLKCFGVSLCFAGFGLGVGTVGYRIFAGFDWVDSFLNASMILTGMGPVGALNTTAAKLFASAYALFSGIVFLTMVVTVITPIIHRILHVFHLDDPREK
jgi:hypothetical protein